MDLIVIPLTAFLGSILTFFSGFGLGTILLPVFAIWFPIDMAVALTAVVHFLNNIFKLALVGRHASKAVIIRFGMPAVFSAILGAAILVKVSDLTPLLTYGMFGKTLKITPVKLTISILMIAFTLFEIVPKFKKLQIDPKFLSVGGIISGFFGGLSGHQGALRSAFLVRVGLTKESFIATGTVIACLIDFARIGVYLKHFVKEGFTDSLGVTVLSTFAAFSGAYIGSKVLQKITMDAVQVVVSAGLFLLAIAIGVGIV